MQVYDDAKSNVGKLTRLSATSNAACLTLKANGGGCASREARLCALSRTVWTLYDMTTAGRPVRYTNTERMSEPTCRHRLRDDLWLQRVRDQINDIMGEVSEILHSPAVQALACASSADKDLRPAPEGTDVRP